MLKLICIIPRPLSAVGMPHFRKTWSRCAVELEFASCQKKKKEKEKKERKTPCASCIDNVGCNYICPADCIMNPLNVILTFELADDDDDYENENVSMVWFNNGIITRGSARHPRSFVL